MDPFSHNHTTAIGRTLNSGWLPQPVVRLASNNPNMKVLRLSLPYVEHDLLRAYMRSVRDHKYLEELWLDGDDIETDIAHSLAASLQVNTQLRILRLCKCPITGYCASIIFDAIRDNATLTELYLERNDMQEDAVKSLRAMICCNKSLKVLHINDNPIGAYGLQSVCEALRQNTSLEELCLQRGCIGGPICSEAIGRMVLHNQTLKRLRLINTKLRSSDVVILAKHLEQNKTLEELVLAGSRTNVEAAIALGELAKRTKTLKGLTLWGNGLKDEGALAVSEGVKVNRSLTEFCLVMNGLSDLSVPALVDAVINHPRLRKVDVSGNRIHEGGGKLLAEMLQQNDRIVALDSYGNDFGAQREIVSKWQRFNNAGRRLIKVPNLSRNEFLDLLVKNQAETDLIFFLLRERPDMMTV